MWPLGQILLVYSCAVVFLKTGTFRRKIKSSNCNWFWWDLLIIPGEAIKSLKPACATYTNKKQPPHPALSGRTPLLMPFVDVLWCGFVSCSQKEGNCLISDPSMTADNIPRRKDHWQLPDPFQWVFSEERPMGQPWGIFTVDSASFWSMQLSLSSQEQSWALQNTNWIPLPASCWRSYVRSEYA